MSGVFAVSGLPYIRVVQHHILPLLGGHARSLGEVQSCREVRGRLSDFALHHADQESEGGAMGGQNSSGPREGEVALATDACVLTS